MWNLEFTQNNVSQIRESYESYKGLEGVYDFIVGVCSIYLFYFLIVAPHNKRKASLMCFSPK